MRDKNETTMIMWILFLTLAFLGVAALQCLNVADTANAMLKVPRCTWLPWSIELSSAVRALIGWVIIAVCALAAYDMQAGTVRRYALAGVTAFAVLGLLQGRFGRNLSVPHSLVPYANHAGSVLLCGAVLALCGRQRMWVLLAGLFGVCAYLLHARYSAGGIAALIACRMVPGKYRGRAMLAACILIAVGLAWQATYLWQGRQYEIGVTYRILREYPAFGAGSQAHVYLAPIYAPVEAMGWWARHQNGHSDILMWLTEYGLIGCGLLAGIGWATVSMIRPYVRWNIASMGLVLVGIHAIFDSPFHAVPVMILIVSMAKTACQEKNGGLSWKQHKSL